MSSNERDIHQHDTVANPVPKGGKGGRSATEPVLSPGPAEPGDKDFKTDRDRRSAGYSGVPGAGPNPSAPE